MASGDTLFNIDLRELAGSQVQPRAARVEQHPIFDTNGLPILRTVAVFDKGGGISNPEIIVEFIMPANYANTTGLTLAGFCAPQKPRTTGNARLDFAVEALLSNTASNTYDATSATDPGGSWGTPAAATVDVATATAGVGGVKSFTLPLVKANTGPAAIAAAGTTLHLCRLRMRRLSTDALDTLTGALLVFGLQLKET